LSKYAVSASETGEERVVLNKKDRERMGEKLVAAFNAALKAAGKTAGLTLSEREADIVGGFLLSSGDVETDCGIASLLEQRKYGLSDTVIKILFC
jgi:hypothetical protein